MSDDDRKSLNLTGASDSESNEERVVGLQAKFFITPLTKEDGSCKDSSSSRPSEHSTRSSVSDCEASSSSRSSSTTCMPTALINIKAGTLRNQLTSS